MPKSGPYQATPDEWKVALKAKLDELGWTYTQLAEKVGISRAAISHIVNSSLASSHVEAIEKAVGGLNTRKAEQAWKAAEVAAAKEKLATRSPAAPRPAAEVAELISYFQELSPEHKARVIERARTLWEEERLAPASTTKESV
jgi:transcriptional regulator with XRE-family HTH domain